MELSDLLGSYGPQGFAGIVAALTAWATVRAGLAKAVKDAVHSELTPLRAEVTVLSERVEVLEMNGQRAKLMSVSRPAGDEG